MKHSDVVIVIPVYKAQLDDFERVSLCQLRKILRADDCCFLAPKSLAFDYGELGAGIDVRRYDDRYFVSNASYSELMLDVEFYRSFSSYAYMLVYQLDAFVFNDRLLEFCSMGYDYIGSPMRRTDSWRDIGCSVGNGGFSLRKISSMLRVLRRKKEIFARRPEAWEENRFLPAEDLFFSFCATIPELDFHVPDFRTALEFAVGDDVAHAYRDMPSWLPFGCHAWSWRDYWHWRPIIESQGYELPLPEGQGLLRRRRNAVRMYLFRRSLRDPERRWKAQAAFRQFLLPIVHGKPVVLWGGGIYGRKFRKLFKSCAYELAMIFDRSAEEGAVMDGVPVHRPDFEMLEGHPFFIIIASIKYEKEICQELEDHGFYAGQDYLAPLKFLEMVGEQYFQNRKML